MVWIYGGGFAAGSASEPRQDGENLAKKGVVVVSLNYRLGVFGFFSHPVLRTSPLTTRRATMVSWIWWLLSPGCEETSPHSAATRAK